MILNIISFLRNKNRAIITSLVIIAILLYFLVCYFVSLLDNNKLILSIAYKNKVLSERVALLSAEYIKHTQDVARYQCIKDTLATDLALLQSSSKTLSCTIRAGRINLTNLDKKADYLQAMGAITTVDNYVIHGNNLLESEEPNVNNKDFIFILNNIRDELLHDLTSLIKLQEQEPDKTIILVKNTERILSVIIWLIIVTKLTKVITGVDFSANKAREKKVLVVEDNRVTAEILKKIVEDQGYTVLIATNGQEAIDLLQEDRGFLLVFMDCEMPIMGGFEATSNIRREEENKGLARLPIIALTGNITENYKQTCLENGMDEHLGKPIVIAEVINCLNKWSKKQVSSKT